MIRVTRSVLPPGEKATISVIAFAGYADCASAALDATTPIAEASSQADAQYLFITSRCK